MKSYLQGMKNRMKYTSTDSSVTKIMFHLSRLQCPRPITLKKDNIQTRNRKMNKNKMAPLSSPSSSSSGIAVALAASSPAKRQPEGSSDFISAVVPSPSSTSQATVSNTAAADAISADDHATVSAAAASAAAIRQFQLTSSAAAAAAGAAAAAAWLQFPVNHHFNHLPQPQQMNGYDTAAAAAFAPPSNFTSV